MFYYLHRVLYKVGYFKKINSTIQVKKYGKKFTIPVINEMGYYHLLKHENWFPQILEKTLSLTKNAFIDVGMNIGQTMLSFYGLNRSNAYIGFEPNPACIYYCHKLITANHFKNCTIFPVGLSYVNEILTLKMDMDIASGASLVKNFRTNESRYHTEINVAVFPGDVVAEKNNLIPGVIKIDTEGAELEVLLGLKNSIKHYMPICIVEILPVYDLNSENGIFRKKRELEVVRFFTELHYNMYLINESDATLFYLQEIPVHGDMSKTNYLFVHASKTEQLLALFPHHSMTKN